MKEYIERELLLIGVDGCISSLHAQAKGDPIQESAIKLVEATRDYIASLSAADVAQVKHAKKERSAVSKTGLMCTACFSDVDADACFCKYCGARMDEEDEHKAG